MNKGLICEIYKWSLGECSNNGISKNHKSVTLIDNNIPGIFEATENSPAVKIVRRFIGGVEYIHTEPLESSPKNQTGYMSGGTFIYSCDSRFSKISQYPIALHDRTETWEEYRQLSI